MFVRPKRGALVLGAAVAVWACVGSEESGPQERRVESPRVVTEQATRWDSVEPVPYQLFERVYAEGDSTRLLIRVLVLEDPERAALSRTLMTALDSVGRADSSLVAARGVLYTARMTEPGRASLVPRRWGEWAPPGGWGTAEPRTPRTVYRTFIYDIDPGWWDAPEAETEDE